MSTPNRLASGGIEFIHTDSEKLNRKKQKIQRDLIPLIADLVELIAETVVNTPIVSPVVIPPKKKLKAEFQGELEEEQPENSELISKLNKMKFLRDRLRRLQDKSKI